MDDLWGRQELEACFGASTKVVVPWPSAGRAKRDRLPLDDIEHTVRTPPRLTEVDPRELHATQTWVVRSHATFYGTGEWEITGRTSADMHSSANRYPTFLERNGRLSILTGHHRSLAALLAGRPVLARIVGAEPDVPIAVTPHVVLAPVDAAASTVDVAAMADQLRAGQRVVSGADVAAEALAAVGLEGLDDAEISDRLRRAGLA